jgi:hypothetical protein
VRDRSSAGVWGKQTLSANADAPSKDCIEYTPKPKRPALLLIGRLSVDLVVDKPQKFRGLTAALLRAHN